MATTIRLKRRTNVADNSGITLKAGEPFYNSVTKQLFIGNVDEEDIIDKKHLTQITKTSEDNTNIVAFSLGENADNSVSFTINDVSHSTNADIAEKAKALELSTALAIDGVVFTGSTNIHHFYKVLEQVSADGGIPTLNCIPITAISNEKPDITTDLEPGLRATILFPNKYDITEMGVNLNIQSTGFHPVYKHGQLLTSGTFIAGRIYEFIYESEYYHLLSDSISTEDLNLSSYATTKYVDEAISKLDIPADTEIEWDTFFT